MIVAFTTEVSGEPGAGHRGGCAAIPSSEFQRFVELGFESIELRVYSWPRTGYPHVFGWPGLPPSY